MRVDAWILDTALTLCLRDRRDRLLAVGRDEVYEAASCSAEA